MSDYLKTFFIAIVQGVTEWLPISSTGHMIILEDILRLDVSEEFFELFLAVIQLGSALAVVVRYFRVLDPRNIPKNQKSSALWKRIFVATIPAALLGLLFDDLIERVFYNSWSVAIVLIVYGAIFLFIGRIERKRSGTLPPETLPMGTALLIGFFQAFSLIPGTSRSGATMIGCVASGMDRKNAAEFSFFLSLPVMLGASLLRIFDFGFDFSSNELALLAIGVSVAFIVSALTLEALVGIVKRYGFGAFGVYRILLGILLLILL